jgi:hypothetical protein
MATLAMPFDPSVDMAAQQAYARLVASLGGGENAMVSFARMRERESVCAARAADREPRATGARLFVFVSSLRC